MIQMPVIVQNLQAQIYSLWDTVTSKNVGPQTNPTQAVQAAFQAGHPMVDQLDVLGGSLNRYPARQQGVNIGFVEPLVNTRGTVSNHHDSRRTHLGSFSPNRHGHIFLFVWRRSNPKWGHDQESPIGGL